MGQVAQVVRALSCESCARFVCNACTVDSTCCDLCTLHVETEKIDLPESDDEIDIPGCCTAKMSER